MSRLARPLLAGWIFAGGTCLAQAGAGAEELPERWRNWSHVREIQLPEVVSDDGLVALAVEADVFEHSRADLWDLRVIDQSAAEIGYVLYSKGATHRREWRTTRLSDRGFVVGDSTQVLVDTGASDLLHNLLEVRLGTELDDFFARVEVAASADREIWRRVRDRAPIYRFGENGPGLPQTALRIRYPATRHRWLRLRFLERDAEVPIRAVRVCEDVEEVAELVPIASGIALSSDSPDGASYWLTPEPGVNALVAGVSFETERSALYRPVTIRASDDGTSWRLVARGLIHRYPPDPSEDRNLVAAERGATRVRFGPVAAKHFRVEIMDRDDPPIGDLDVTLERQAASLVFRPQGRSAYRLLYGNHRAPSPKYEIASLTTREALSSAVPTSAGPVRRNQRYVSPDPFTERHPYLLGAALGLAVLALAWLAFKALR